MSIFEKNILSIYGQQGSDWLLTLPKRLEHLANLWHVTDIKPFENLTFHYVVSGMRGTTPVVIKMRVEHKSFAQESTALNIYAGNGSVYLLDVDLEQGALLLEHALPGVPLKKVCNGNEDLAIEHCVTIIGRLHQASRSHVPTADEYRFPSIANLLEVLDKNLNLDPKYSNSARALASELLQTCQKSILLHGDLHHDNILQSSRDDFLAIDPHGVMGEPAYEVGAFIRNPIPEILSMPQLIPHRIKKFATLMHMDAQRIQKWSYVQAVLAAAWAIEDKINPEKWLLIADIIRAL